MKKISIDLPIILDPCKLALVLARLDKDFDEIFVPEAFQFIEIWGSKAIPLPPVTLHTFKEEHQADKFLGLEADLIVKDNFYAGISLLHKAHKKGMVTLFESDKYAKTGLELLGSDKHYLDLYRVPFSGEYLNANTDMPGIVLESLIGLQFQKDITPLYGDLDFTKFVKSLQTSEYNPKVVRDMEDPQTENLLKFPQGLRTADFLRYLDQKDFIEDISGRIEIVRSDTSKFKDVAMNALEFGSTLTTDILAFGGLPVSSGILFGYKVTKRLLNKK